MEIKYHVYKKDEKKNEILEDYGIMTISQIAEFCKKFVGDTTKEGMMFNDQEDIDRDINYLKEHGDELWYMGTGDEYIVIEIGKDIL